MRKAGDLVMKLNNIRDMVDECLTLMASGKVEPEKRSLAIAATSCITPDFELNGRAFVKRYCTDLSGAGKFVLVLASLARGDESKDVSLIDIKKSWSKMTAGTLLGIPFNGKYSTEAKEHGWVNSSKQGYYSLSKAWKDIFRSR